MSGVWKRADVSFRRDWQARLVTASFTLRVKSTFTSLGDHLGMTLDLTDDEHDRLNRALSILQARIAVGDHAAARALETARELLGKSDRRILAHAQGVLDDEEERARYG
jgi:hypothetical protein